MMMKVVHPNLGQETQCLQINTPSLENIMLQFKEAVMEDRKDALLAAVNALK